MAGIPQTLGRWIEQVRAAVPPRVANPFSVGPATVPIEIVVAGALAMAVLALALGYGAARFYTSSYTIRGVTWRLLRLLTAPIWWPLVMLRDGLYLALRRLVRRTGTVSYTARIATVAMLLSGVVVAVGGYYLLTASPQVGASSAPVITGFFKLITNPWMYVVAVGLFVRTQLFFLDRALAWRTARETGYSYRTVRRLAEEAKKPDLSACTRVIAQSGDSVAQLADWIDAGLDGDGHDAPSLEEGAPEDGDDGPIPAVRRVDAADSDPEETQEELPLGAQFSLARNDIAAALDIESLLWRFGVVFGLVLFAELVIVKLWVQWYVYPILVGVAAIVAAGYYWLTDFRYRRRLSSLRQERDRTRRADCSILVKTVETPETTMYYLFAGGNAYASRDRERLARVGAEVAQDVLAGRRPRPAIEERNAWLLTRYLPNLEKWTEQREKPAIADQLVETVTDAPEGILPRSILATQVVEHDRGTLFRGLVPVGFGHDPDLVAEVYEAMTDPGTQALVEEPVEVDDVNNDRVEVAAVTRGDRELSPRMLRLRAEFSTWFQRAREARYDLPDMEHASDPLPYRRPETRREHAEAGGTGALAGGAD